MHDVDVRPPREGALHGGEQDGVGLLDAAEGLVGEDDAEAEGVVGGVAFPDDDLAARVELLGQRGQVEATRPAAHYGDAHRCSAD